MTIKELADQLQEKINIKMHDFCALHDESKKLLDKIESLEKKMAVIVKELEPVDSLVRQQNPKLGAVFDQLNKAHGND